MQVNHLEGGIPFSNTHRDVTWACDRQPSLHLQYNLMIHRECADSNFNNKYNTDIVYGNVSYVNLKLPI